MARDGGDFGPPGTPSDGIFCANGLVQPDNRPNPHAEEVRHVYSPLLIRAKSLEPTLATATLTFTSEHLFEPITVDVAWTLREEGWPLCTGVLASALLVEPLASTTATIQLSQDGWSSRPTPSRPCPRQRRALREYHLDVDAFTSRAEGALPRGHPLAHAQFVFPSVEARVLEPLARHHQPAPVHGYQPAPVHGYPLANAQFILPSAEARVEPLAQQHQPAPVYSRVMGGDAASGSAPSSSSGGRSSSAPPSGSTIEVDRSTPSFLRVITSGLVAGFNTTSGALSDLSYLGRNLLLSEMRPNFWRAPVDNDLGWQTPQKLKMWRAASHAKRQTLLHFSLLKAEPTRGACLLSSWRVASSLQPRILAHQGDRCGHGANQTCVTCLYTILPPARPTAMPIGSVGSDGASHAPRPPSMRVECRYLPGSRMRSTMPPLPRFGLSAALDGRLGTMAWHGKGPGETYVDRQTAARVGVYGAPVASQLHPYLRPQVRR